MSSQQETPLRVAVYLRVSTDEQKEKYGLDLQEDAVEGIIKSRGNLDNGKPAMVLAGKQYIYRDEGVSGTIPLDQRPAFYQMKEDIEDAPEGAKPFDVVAVYRIDRFARKLKILLEVIDYFEKYKIQFVSANESIDTSTPFGRAMLGIIGVIAELEIATTKARTEAGRKQARNKGVYMGANAPFGYNKNKDKQLIIFEEEARTVKTIFDMFVVQKKNAQQIANHLTENEILTPLPSAIYYGKRKSGNNKVNEPNFWRDNTVRDTLKNEIYIGKYYYNKSKDNKRLPKSEWKLSPHHHVPIIDKATFGMAQERIREEVAIRNSKKSIDKHLYLLSGLLKCNSCYDPYSDQDKHSWTGTRKEVKKKNETIIRYYYQCTGKNPKKHPKVKCKAIPFPADEIEQFVIDFIKDLLEDPKAIFEHMNSLKSTKLRKKKLKEEQKDLIDRLNAIPDRKTSVQYQHEHNFIDNSELNIRMKKIKGKEKELNKKLLDIENKLANEAISTTYNQALKMFAKTYQPTLKGKMDDRQELYDLIHLIVDKIHVYSRKVTEKDAVAGRKTADRMIPHEIRIDLRLPQDMLARFAQEGKFEVRNADL